jgi:hypothetical protein
MSRGQEDGRREGRSKKGGLKEDWEGRGGWKERRRMFERRKDRAEIK